MGEEPAAVRRLKPTWLGRDGNASLSSSSSKPEARSRKLGVVSVDEAFTLIRWSDVARTITTITLTFQHPGLRRPATAACFASGSVACQTKVLHSRQMTTDEPVLI
jgi:hypothetical protein